MCAFIVFPDLLRRFYKVQLAVISNAEPVMFSIFKWLLNFIEPDNVFIEVDTILQAYNRKRYVVEYGMLLLRHYLFKYACYRLAGGQRCIFLKSEARKITPGGSSTEQL